MTLRELKKTSPPISSIVCSKYEDVLVLTGQTQNTYTNSIAVRKVFSFGPLSLAMLSRRITILLPNLINS